ncbi:MAG: hypothetical protein KC550_07315 [Nanoarchaeota archaeon]|nr:hypothetical protein [Nanoarchaeota archaeon]
MKKFLFIISFYDFNKNILEYSKEYLISLDYKVNVAAKCNIKKIIQKLKIDVDIDLNSKEINLDEYKTIFLISNTSSSKNCLDDSTINKIILNTTKKNILIGDIIFNSKKKIKEYIDCFLN